MTRIFRIMFRVTVGIVGLAVFAGMLAYWFAARSLPDYDQTTQVEGLSGSTEIVRNTSNIPHIFAQSDEDVFFGLGYAHAQDRLWQMVFMRRVGQGRLSEVFGERTLRTDVLMRRLDLYRVASQAFDAQDERTKAALEAYAAGVNAWLGQVRDGAKGRGAPEFWLFKQPIAPWTPTDSLAVLKLLSVQLSSHIEEEVLQARLSLALDDQKKVEQLLGQSGTPDIAALPRYASLSPSLSSKRFAQARSAAPDFFPIAARGFGGASNAFAAAPTRSASGATLLASDPHLGFSAPAVWYLARLELESGGIIGGTTPGLPLILSGRSNDLAWGVTTAYVDDQDLYLEEVNPDDAGQYRTAEGWADFISRDTIITVKDAPAVTVQLQWTERGPVLDDEMFDLGQIRPPGHVISLAWTALEPNDTTMSAAMALMRSANIAQALRATEGYIAPAQNLTLADRNRIAIATIGAIPKRNEAHKSQGVMPSYGYLPENQWGGVFPASSNPRIVNPEGGIVGNTNNRLSAEPFPRHVSHHYGDTQRVFRWTKLMQEREVHTRESFIGAQLDTVSEAARRILPMVGANLWFTGEAAAEGTAERRRQKALELLAAWNGEMNEHLPEPLIYAAWMRALQKRLISDELGPLSNEFTQLEPLFIQKVFSNTDGASAWCDVIQSAKTETCTDIARAALDDALVWIGERYGNDVESLRWGDAHTAMHDHPVLGEVPVLNWFVNIRQSSSGGDNTLMRGLSRGTGSRPFENIHGAGFRGVYDMADPESSVFIISTGQSGHPLSRHYDDLSELWRRGEYIQMALDPMLARAAAVGITHLEPKEPRE